MGVKLQINPSTGKLSFNAVTGKVQVINTGVEPGEDCYLCEGLGYITPKFVQATVEGVTTVDNGCYDCGGSCPRDVSWEGLIDVNGVYVLEQSPSSECFFSLEIPNTVTVTEWNSTDGSCSGGVFKTTTAESLGIFALINAPTVVEMFIGHFDVNLTAFFVSRLVEERVGDDCMSTNTVDNEVTFGAGCAEVIGVLGCQTGSRVGYGGTMTILEI